MSRLVSIISGAVILALLLTSAQSAKAEEFPVMLNWNETLPPNQEDWFQYFYTENVRREFGPATKCQKLPCEAYGPLVLWPEIVYFPCTACGMSCGPVHQSMKGTYGIAFPMPYYIPNPTIAVEINDWCNGTSSRDSWRFPNNRIELTIGVWE